MRVYFLPRLENHKAKKYEGIIATLLLYKDFTYLLFIFELSQAEYRMTFLISRRQNVMTAGAKRITAGSFAPAVNMLK